MLESIDRLNRLIEDLLVFSSPQAAESDDRSISSKSSPRPCRWRRHGLSAIGRSRCRSLRSAGAVWSCAAIASASVQVLTNIVLNGVQATPDGGRVTVCVPSCA